MTACIALFTMALSSCGFKEFGELEEDFEGKTITEQIKLIMDNEQKLDENNVDMQEQYISDVAQWYSNLSDEEKSEVVKYGDEQLEGDLKNVFDLIITKAGLANFENDLKAQTNALNAEEPAPPIAPVAPAAPATTAPAAAQ